jgi:hypothetical protein
MGDQRFGRKSRFKGNAALRILPSGIWMLRVALGDERPHSSLFADLIGDRRQRAGRLPHRPQKGVRLEAGPGGVRPRLKTVTRVERNAHVSSTDPLQDSNRLHELIRGLTPFGVRSAA